MLFPTMSYFAPFALFAFINLLGAMLPGPDFAIVTRYGLTGSRRLAILTSLGITFALFIHVAYCLLGIAVVLQNSLWLFFSLQMAGALYLLYLGVRLLRSQGKETREKEHKRLIQHHAFREGFLTNLLNPKASLFLLSLFAGFIDISTPLWSKILYGFLVPMTAFGWFSFLSIMLTHRRFLPHLQKYQVFFMKTMGIMLAFLSILVILSAIGHAL